MRVGAADKAAIPQVEVPSVFRLGRARVARGLMPHFRGRVYNRAMRGVNGLAALKFIFSDACNLGVDPSGVGWEPELKGITDRRLRSGR